MTILRLKWSTSILESEKVLFQLRSQLFLGLKEEGEKEIVTRSALSLYWNSIKVFQEKLNNLESSFLWYVS